MPNYVVALDPGQKQDPAALVVIEKVEVARDGPTDPQRLRWDIAYAQQWALGTPHTAVVDDTIRLLAQDGIAGARLLFDATGVGAVYTDLLRQAFRDRRLAMQATPIILTAGLLDNGTHLAKRNVIGALEAKLSNGLLVVRNIPLRREIEKQFRSFRLKYTQSGADTYEALRDGKDHDDLVIAIALGSYWRNVGGNPPRYQARDGGLFESRAHSADPY
jgi:hypothetical protein